MKRLMGASSVMKCPSVSVWLEVEGLMVTLRELNDHRKKINENFDRRREIMYMAFPKKVTVKQPIITDFDKILDGAVLESNELTS